MSDYPPMPGDDVTVGPSLEELAAIAVAVDQAWPRPSRYVLPGAQRQGVSTWRFSGRWWAVPTPLRRDRPWARR